MVEFIYSISMTPLAERGMELKSNKEALLYLVIGLLRSRNHVVCKCNEHAA